MILLGLLMIYEKPAFAFNEAETKLLAGLVMAEAGGECYEGQLAVANVVINRLEHGFWGDDIGRVIYAKGQFARPKKQYSDMAYLAAEETMAGRRILPECALYFQKAKVDYFYGEWLVNIGGHNFYGSEEECQLH